VPADQHHAQLAEIAREMDVPDEAVLLNADEDAPFEGTQLDSTDAVKALEGRIRKHAPALVVIDTSLNATDKGCTKPEDAKAFFVPLMQVAQRCGVPILCVTHLNANGKALGLRIRGQCRSVINQSQPDPEGQPNRRKLWVEKSMGKPVKALGVTMRDGGNDYDCNPPEPAQEKSQVSPEVKKCADWLTERIAGDSVSQVTLHNEREAKRIDKSTFYAAAKYLGLVEETRNGRKHFRFPDADGDS
jgi:hypothetical protein